MGARDREPGEALGQHLARFRLVSGRAVRVDERDDKRLGAFPVDQPGRLPYELLAVKRRVDGAVGQDPLGDLAHAIARDQRRRARGREVDRAGQTEPLDLEHVAEAGRDQEPECGPVPLDHGVDGDRGAVDQVVD